MHSRLEAPPLRRFYIHVVVVAVVLDLVRIAAEADHQHVDNSDRAGRCRRDDVVGVEVTDALFDPADVLAAQPATARRLGESIASFETRAGLAVDRRRKYAVRCVEVGVVVAVVRASIERSRVLRDQLFDLDVVHRREDHRLRSLRRGIFQGRLSGGDRGDRQCRRHRDRRILKHHALSYSWPASRTITLMRSMLLSRMGHVLSVDTHSARPRPQPHEQRASLAALSAAFLPFGDKSEKLTTPIARSSYGTPAD